MVFMPGDHARTIWDVYDPQGVITHFKRTLDVGWLNLVNYELTVNPLSTLLARPEKNYRI